MSEHRWRKDFVFLGDGVTDQFDDSGAAVNCRYLRVAFVGSAQATLYVNYDRPAPRPLPPLGPDQFDLRLNLAPASDDDLGWEAQRRVYLGLQGGSTLPSESYWVRLELDVEPFAGQAGPVWPSRTLAPPWELAKTVREVRQDPVVLNANYILARCPVNSGNQVYLHRLFLHSLAAAPRHWQLTSTGQQDPISDLFIGGSEDVNVDYGGLPTGGDVEILNLDSTDGIYGFITYTLAP